MIVANFTRTGRLDQLDASRAIYIDQTVGPQSYQEALNLVENAHQAFYALPSDIREQFHNSPEEFLVATNENPDAVYGVLKPRDAVREAQAAPIPPAETNAPQPPANAPAAPSQTSVS